MEILLVRIIRLPQFYRQMYLKPQCSRHYQISPQVIRNPIYPSLFHFDSLWSILTNFDSFWSILIHFDSFPFQVPPQPYQRPRTTNLQPPKFTLMVAIQIPWLPLLLVLLPYHLPQHLIHSVPTTVSTVPIHSVPTTKLLITQTHQIVHISIHQWP